MDLIDLATIVSWGVLFNHFNYWSKTANPGTEGLADVGDSIAIFTINMTTNYDYGSSEF